PYTTLFRSRIVPGSAARQSRPCGHSWAASARVAEGQIVGVPLGREPKRDRGGQRSRFTAVQGRGSAIPDPARQRSGQRREAALADLAMVASDWSEGTAQGWSVIHACRQNDATATDFDR